MYSWKISHCVDEINRLLILFEIICDSLKASTNLKEREKGRQSTSVVKSVIYQQIVSFLKCNSAEGCTNLGNKNTSGTGDH